MEGDCLGFKRTSVLTMSRPLPSFPAALILVSPGGGGTWQATGLELGNFQVGKA